MCIVIDANRLAAIFQLDPPREAVIVRQWIDDRGGRIVFGGKLAEEYHRVRVARGWLREANRAGRAILIESQRMANELNVVQQQPLQSDDPHVIALARAAGVRVLYSDDQDLQSDFKDNRLISRPGGRVFGSPRMKDGQMLGQLSKAQIRALLRGSDCGQR